MLIRLIRDARVNLPAGAEVEVTEAEAARLVAFGEGERAEKQESAPAAKKAKKK